MCELRFNDVIGQSTVPINSYTKIPKYMAKQICFETLFL